MSFQDLEEDAGLGAVQQWQVAVLGLDSKYHALDGLEAVVVYLGDVLGEPSLHRRPAVCR